MSILNVSTAASAAAAAAPHYTKNNSLWTLSTFTSEIKRTLWESIRSTNLTKQRWHPMSVEEKIRFVEEARVLLYQLSYYGFFGFWIVFYGIMRGWFGLEMDIGILTAGGPIF